MKMPLTSKSDEENQLDADTGLNGDFEMPLANQDLYGLISCKEYKNQLLEVSKTFDSLSNKNTFNNSETKYFQSHHFENVDSFPFDDCKKTYSEELKQKNNEYLNEKEDLKDANGKMAKIAEDNFSHLERGGGGEEGGGGGNREELYESCDDPYEMTYIELDLSSQDNQQVSDDDIFIEMMKNLKIKPNKISLDSNFSDFYSDTTKSFKDYSNEQNKGNESSQPDLVSNTMKENFNLDDTTTTITNGPLYPITTAHKLVHSSFNNNNNDSQKECSLNELGPKSSNFYLKKEKRPEFFGSFLSVIESNLCSLPERAYAQIAAHLLDEETILDAEDCDPDSLNKNNISIVMSEMELSISDEADSTYQTMTYIDLDINECCSEDITLELFNKLNIKDDDTLLCRGNSSDQNEVQNDSLGSNIVETDFKVLSNTHLISANMIDINSFTNISIDPSMETLLSDNGFNSGSADSVSNNSLAKKNVKNSSEIETMGPSPSSSEIGLTQTCVLPPQTSLTTHCTNAPDLSFFDVNFQNEDNSYESEFVTENLHELEEIKEILGLTEPSIPNTISPPPTKKMMMMTSTPPPAVAPSPSPPCNISPLPWQQMWVVNKISTEKSFQSNKVVPRITTQTCVTQSEAMAAFPGFFLVMSPSSMHSLKRTAFSEVLEPIKKPYRCDNSLQSGSRNKLKKHVSSLKDENLLEFKDNESCLHKAVRTMNTEYVSALLKRLHKLESSNLDIINYKNENLQTALHLAVQENTPAIVHLLIQNGAEVNLLALTSSNRLEAPLHYVASRGNQFRLIFQHLLKTNDLNLNIKNSTGQTALHCAVLAHNTMDSKSFSTIDSNYIITKLLTKNADPCIQDSNGKNVLMLALESKDEKLVRQILKTVNKEHIHQLLTATSKNGQTCFDLAFSLKEQFHESSYEKVIHLLTQYKNT